MDAADLQRELPDNFRNDAAKSINRKGVFNKERPALSGSPEEWKGMIDNEMKAKRAASKAGISPEITDDWTDAQWKEWEAKNRVENPRLWAKMDAADKARVKAEPASTESDVEEPERPVAGN